MHVFGGNAQGPEHVEFLVVLVLDFVIQVIVVRGYLGLRLAPEHQRYLVHQRNPQGIGITPGMTVPAEIRLSLERFQHQALDDFPVRRELKHIDAQFLERTLIVFFNDLAHETMVETNNQGLQLVFLHQVIQLESTVLAARERDDAIVIALAAVFLDQLVEQEFALVPVDRLLLVNRAATDIANTCGIEFDGFVGFRQAAFDAAAEHWFGGHINILIIQILKYSFSA